MSSEINSKNIIMGRSDEVSEDAYKVFEELQRVAKECRKVAKAKEIQEFISCFKKDHQGFSLKSSKSFYCISTT
jgi:hypothetical protein